MDGRPGRLGFAYEEVSGQLARYFKVDDGGLLVTDVDAEGPAGHAGLRAGDIVVKIQGKVVSDPEVLRRALDDVAPGAEVALSVQRDGHALDLKVTPRTGGERRERS
ncbi:MAG TPA: PDZ domain-containing protein, partial [Vicinamibacteria bacterium]|nr:PDZ domain-containing protein [Vicinamibacteria bacterium]